jgi:hypothetical protein
MPFITTPLVLSTLPHFFPITPPPSADAVAALLGDYPNLVVARVTDDPGTRFGRLLAMSEPERSDVHAAFFIGTRTSALCFLHLIILLAGCEGRTLTNLMLHYNKWPVCNENEAEGEKKEATKTEEKRKKPRRRRN